MSDTPGDTDPRLEIPEVLRTPVKKPDFPETRRPTAAAGGSGFQDLGKALSIGLDFLFTIGAGGGLGWLLDRWRGWTPYSLMIGLALGFAAATVRIIQRSDREDRARKAGPGPRA
jgi:ATP synthase protein I